jgi:hypothetical protein
VSEVGTGAQDGSQQHEQGAPVASSLAADTSCNACEVEGVVTTVANNNRQPRIRTFVNRS